MWRLPSFPAPSVLVTRLTSAVQGLVAFACGNALIWMFFFVCASLQCCIPGWILWCRHLCKYSLMCMLSLYITRVILFTSLLPSLTLFCLFTILCLSERIEKNISHIGRPFCSLHLSLFSGAELTLQSNAEWMQKDVKNVCACMEGRLPSKLKFKGKIKTKQKHSSANPQKLVFKNQGKLSIINTWSMKILYGEIQISQIQATLGIRKCHADSRA